MTKRAVTYARVSSDDRAKTGGENLADQTRLCREHARKSGYHVVADFTEDDRGASGATVDLPQLSKVVTMARDGAFDVLIVRELDRLSRSLAKQLIIEQELKRAGVAIEYVLYDFPDTPEGRLNKNLRAMLAEYEREKIKQRMMRGRLRKIRNGAAINHGHPPFGYRNTEIDGKAALEINEEEAKTVRLIFQWYTEGDGERGPMSIRAIAKQLTKLHIPTYSDLRKKTDCTAKSVSKRGHWGISSVSSMLANETYTGTWYYGRRNWDREDQIPVDVPVIIDKETWEETQRRREKNKRESKRNRKYNYLLSGCLVCGECGRIMAATPTYSYYKGKRSSLILYYVCQAHRRGYPCKMKDTRFRVDDIDKAAWAWVRGLLTDPEKLEDSMRTYKAQREELSQPLRERLGILTDLITDNQEKLDRLLDLYLSGDFPQDILAGRKIQIEQEQTKLKAEQARIQAQLQEQEFSEDRLQSILEFARTISAGIEKADQDFNKRRELIQALEVTGELSVDDGEKVLYLHCVIGETIRIVFNSLNDAGSLCRGSCCTSSQTRDRAVLLKRVRLWLESL